jgi:hypothetical protein
MKYFQNEQLAIQTNFNDQCLRSIDVCPCEQRIEQNETNIGPSE